jgi:citrate synthase
VRELYQGSDVLILKDLAELAQRNNTIKDEFYDAHDIKRGLRNSNGTGVAVGLTAIGSVHGYELIDNKKTPAEGRLFYRGIDIYDIVNGFQKEGRYGYEECVYLLLFGELPSKEQMERFNKLLYCSRQLPTGFIENAVFKTPSRNLMNMLQRCTLFLYSYDENPDDSGVENLVRQSIELTARFPVIISYSYQAKAHYFDKKSLFIHPPQKNLSTAENILHMIRPDNKYTKVEAEILDLCLVLHAEHGGGNNSTFAARVVSSSETDTYSAVAAAVGSLKGPKHGSANIKVHEMVLNIKENVSNIQDKGKLKDYLLKIIKKEAFDKKGLIYGMGHAVYTSSDPRALLLKKKAFELAVEKDALDEFNLYKNIEELTVELFKDIKGEDIAISANMDLYSGLVYEMLGIPPELYTPLFAAARVASWCAHRIEQIVSDRKIIRPAYKCVSENRHYIPLAERKDITKQGCCKAV